MIALLSVWKFLKAVPWQVYAGIALIILIAWLRSHWIGVGLERCESAYKAEMQKQLAKSIEQAIQAPAVAQAAREAVKPKVEQRVKYVRELVKAEPVSCSDAYGDRVQSEIRQARAAIDSVR